MKFPRKKKAQINPYAAHKIVKIDEWAPGHRRIWCSCGARCIDGIRLRAEDVYRQHVESQTT